MVFTFCYCLVRRYPAAVVAIVGWNKVLALLRTERGSSNLETVAVRERLMTTGEVVDGPSDKHDGQPDTYLS